MNVRDLSIRVKLFSLIAIYAIGFGVFITALARSADLERTSMAKVVEMKDLVADVLPPPKYVIESYLTLLQLSYEADAVEREELIKTWDRLKKEFEERQTYWDGALPDSRLKQALVQDSTAAARELFTVADREFLPAVRAGERDKVRELLTGKIHQAYERHRASINDVVKAANKESEVHARDAVEVVASGKRQIATIGLSILAVCLAFGWAVSRSITGRVKSMVGALNAVAEGDLTPRLDDASNDDLGKMSRALNAAVAGMSGALSEVQALSATLTSAAGDLSASADSLASGAHEQAASLQETAASLEEITATVRQSSDNAQEASQLATGSRQSAERGGAVVAQANTAMTEINDASDRISNIITTIDEIAFQTNILALNAAVEAARAGEQGRGFAVVAAQVGTLSQRSSDAAKEIKALIQDSVKKVAGGAALVSRSGQSLSEILKSVTCVTDLVTEMAAAFREQSTGMNQISTAVAQMDEVMQATSSQTETLSGTAGRLNEQAERLRELLGRFRLSGSAAEATAQSAAPAPPAARPRSSPPRFRRAPAMPADDARAARTARDAPGAPRLESPRAGSALTARAESGRAAAGRAESSRGPASLRDTAPAAGPEPVDGGMAAMDAAMAAANGVHEPGERGFEEI